MPTLSDPALRETLPAHKNRLTAKMQLGNVHGEERLQYGQTHHPSKHLGSNTFSARRDDNFFSGPTCTTENANKGCIFPNVYKQQNLHEIVILLGCQIIVNSRNHSGCNQCDLDVITLIAKCQIPQ